MNRSNSWKNLEKTFAIQTKKSQSINRTKLKNSIASECSVTGDECQIDDSDEENHPSSRNHSKTVQQSKKTKRKSREILTLNTTLNSSALNSTQISSSDTDDNIDCEPQLHDVSNIKTPQKRFKRNRFQSLTFLSIQKSNQSTPKNGSHIGFDTSNNLVQNKRSWSIKRNNFNNNKTSCNFNETIIESDSTDDDTGEKSPPKKCRNKNGFRPLTMDDSGPNVIIDTPSTQQSIKMPSPTNFTPKDKKLTKLKGIKGGWLERLTKAISRTKSDYSFWMNERTVDLIEPGDRLFIKKIEQSYGKILLYCSSDGVDYSDTDADANADDGSAIDLKCHQYTKVICLDAAYKRLSTLHVGKTIEAVLDATEYVIEKDLCFYPYLSKIMS